MKNDEEMKLGDRQAAKTSVPLLLSQNTLIGANRKTVIDYKAICLFKCLFLNDKNVEK